MAERYDVLIVGGGHGGAQVAIALRQRKFAGSIAIVGDEPDYPYERPPLSKEYLAEEKGFERILIRQPDFWAERDVAMLRSRRVTAIDPERRVVQTDDDETIGYGELVWSAGGAPRTLGCEGGDLAGVHSVRNRADVDRMMGELRDTTSVVVIGGGYIGLEAAAVLRKLDKQVTVLEALDRVLARVAGEPLSRFFEAEHRAKGVDVRLAVRVESLVGTDGRVSGVRLEDGSIIPCEMVVVGIGIVPAIAPLEAAGAETGNGVSVDRFCRTSIPHVFAMGDCALHENPFADGLLVRVESVANANDMATTVARVITGDPQPHHAVPWFWSNQYDLKLQTVGLSTGHDDAILRGDPAARSFSIVYRRGGGVIALDCVNATKDYVQGRKLVEARSTADAALLADPDVPLKSLTEGSPVVSGAVA